MKTISKSKLAKLATITVKHEPEHIPIDGNASAIDRETDDKTNALIRAELESGNDWAWCVVIVIAEYDDEEGRATLGACSYRDERAFRTSGDLSQMRREAIDELHAKLVERDRKQAAELTSQPGEVAFTGAHAIVTHYERRKIRVSSHLGHGATKWDPALSRDENHTAAAVEWACRWGLMDGRMLVGAYLPGNRYTFVPIVRGNFPPEVTSSLVNHMSID